MTVESQITSILEEAFSPNQLKVINESRLHAGHAGNDGSGESHFRIEIVSRKFEGMSRIQAHRMVYDALKKELKILPHALSIMISSPDKV